MRRLAHLALPLAAALALAACGKPATPEEPASAPAPAAASQPAPVAAVDWSSLEALADKYPSDTKLLEASAVTPTLEALLGAKFETLKTNMQTQSPLQRDGGLLYTSGNKQHEGGVNMAYVLIDPKAKAVEVGLWEGGKLTVYKTDGATLAKPKDVQTMIDNAAA